MQWLAAIPFLLAALPQEAADPKLDAVKKALEEVAADKGDLSKLTLTWDDLHGLHGGLTLTITGDGKVSQKAAHVKPGEPKEKVDPKDVKELVKLLVRHEAWAQRVPERAAVPDESRAWFTIAVGDQSVMVWEWYNDLAKNKRLVEVRDLMKKFAWK